MSAEETISQHPTACPAPGRPGYLNTRREPLPENFQRRLDKACTRRKHFTTPRTLHDYKGHSRLRIATRPRLWLNRATSRLPIREHQQPLL